MSFKPSKVLLFYACGNLLIGSSLLFKFSTLQFYGGSDNFYNALDAQVFGLFVPKFVLFFFFFLFFLDRYINEDKIHKCFQGFHFAFALKLFWF